MDQYSIRPRVGFLEAIKSVFKQYTKYSGRSRRSEFWYFALINNIIQLILIIIMIATIEKIESSSYSYPYVYYYTYYKVNPIVQIVALIYSLAVLCPSFCLNIRRLHDIGKSGYYLFLAFIPIIGIIILIVFFCFDSQREQNEYGPSPKYFINEVNPIAYQPNPLIPVQSNSDVQLTVNPQQDPYLQPQPNMIYPPNNQ